MADKNTTVLGKFLQGASNDFIQRLPNGTKSTMKQVIDSIFDPMNGMMYNEFASGLVNRIGMTKVHDKQWNNPLDVFKGEKLIWGQTVQEIAPKWIKAHSYLDDAETLLKMNRPEMEACYHSVDRQDKYAITVNREELRMAFANETGLDSLATSLLTVPVNSDNYDEYNAMMNLLAYYDESWGFYKVQVKTDGTDEENAKDMLKQFQTIAGKIQFPSTLYNAGVVTDIPVFEQDPSKMVLLTTPEVAATLNVDALAVLFHVEKAEVPYRIVLVNEFPMADAQALLTTEDFFVFHDYVYETQSFFNPETLSTNYFLHHWEVLSVSPFVPAILFTTEEGTVNATVTEELSSIDIQATTTAAPGEIVPMEIAVKGTLTADMPGVDYENMTVAPTSATWSVAAYKPGEPATETDPATPDTPIQLNTRTYVDRLGRLHIQKSGLKAGDVITVTAKSTYVNPSGSTPTDLVDTHNITIVDGVVSA